MLKRPAAALLFSLTGCATTHSLSPLALEFNPAIRESRAPGFSAFKYVTFSVMPLGAVNPAGGLKDEKLGRAVLYATRNMLEAYGYRFVYVTDHPDFIVGVDLAEPIRSPSRSGVVVTAPEVSPDGLAPQPPATAESLAATDQYAWGMPQPSAPGLAPLPGWPPPDGKTAPASGYWLTRVEAVALDGKTLAPVWAGSGAGLSRTGDPRVHAQLVLWSVLRQLPAASYTEMADAGDVGGIALEVVTPDGVNFYPAVRAVVDGSPAWKAGVMPSDVILAIGGEPMWGKPWRECRSALQGAKNSEVALTMWRNGRQVNLIARREAAAAGVGCLTAGRERFWPLSRTKVGLVMAGR